MLRVMSSRVKSYDEYEVTTRNQNILAILTWKNSQVMDFFGLVASVGGSLGLFLGFSFYECLKTARERGYLHLKKRMNLK